MPLNAHSEANPCGCNGCNDVSPQRLKERPLSRRQILAAWFCQIFLLLCFGLEMPNVQAQSLGDALNTNLVWSTGGDSSWFAETNVALDGLAAQAGPLGNNQQAWVETTVTNSGTVIFWWKANTQWWTQYPSTLIGGTLDFYLNGSLSNLIKGQTGWQQQAVYCAAATNVLQWDCTVVNSLLPGSDEGWLDEVTFISDPAAPQVLGVPQPPQQKVATGTTVNISATVIGTPPLFYQWQQNGTNVPDATNATLTLTNVTVGQAGEYSLIVSNTSGGTTSSNATLEVEPNVPVSWLGQWPGYDRGAAQCVILNGNLAYVGDGAGATYGAFLVLDVSNPGRPVLLGTLNGITDNVNDLCQVGHYVYAACGNAGLCIIDVSNPSNPVLVGTCGISASATGVRVAGNYAYVTSYGWTGFSVVDISNPAQPVVVGTSSTGGGYYQQGLCLNGSYAYVVEAHQGMSIMDISEPTNPVVAAYLSLPGYADEIQVVSNYALVADAWGGLQTVDVSDPTNPVVVTNLAFNSYSISIVGTNAYIASDLNFKVVNVSDPTQPQVISTINLQDTPVNIQVVNNLAYVADYNSGLQMVDISNPLQPAWAGFYDCSGNVSDADVEGNLAFVADGKGGLQIVDMSNPLQPASVGSYYVLSDNGATDVKVAGNLAYVAGNSAGLQIVDVSDPTHPVLKGACTNTYAENLDVAGHYAYVGGGPSGFEIVDVSNPCQPVQVNQTNITTQGDTVVKVAGNFAYLAPWYGSGLTIADVSNPAWPVEISSLSISLPTGVGLYDYVIVSNLLYTSAMIADISNPYQPVQVGQYNDGGWVHVVDNDLLVADFNLSVFDVSDPTQVVLVAQTNVPASDSSFVTTMGQYALVGDLDWGLQLYQLPTNFVTAPCLAPWPTNLIVFAGSTLTLAANASGQPPLTYQWLFDGAPVNGGTNWILAFTNIQTSAAGSYSVIVGNGSGAATNQTTLTVIVRPNILVGGPNGFGYNTSGQFYFSFLTQTGAEYAVEYVNSLSDTNWTVLTNVWGNDLPMQVLDPNPTNSSRFYRVQKE